MESGERRVPLREMPRSALSGTRQKGWFALGCEPSYLTTKTIRYAYGSKKLLALLMVLNFLLWVCKNRPPFVKIEQVSPAAQKTKGGRPMDESSLSHTRWDCKYHVVFAPKFRRKEIYGKIQTDIGKILRQLCDHKGVEIMEANACEDHIHMLLKIPPKMSVSSFMGFLKGKSPLMIFERHANLKYRYGNRHFWCKGYYVSTVGRNKEAIKKYIQEQVKEDMIRDQMTIKEYIDPFKGQPVP